MDPLWRALTFIIQVVTLLYLLSFYNPSWYTISKPITPQDWSKQWRIMFELYQISIYLIAKLLTVLGAMGVVWFVQYFGIA